MNIQQARKILGKQGDNISDGLIQEDIDTSMLLVDLIIDSFLKMTPAERVKFIKNQKIKNT